MNRSTTAIAFVLLAACARSEEASMGPLDSNQARQVEAVRSDRGEQEVALGAWREALQDDQRVLEFGPNGAPPSFSLRCDARLGVILQRHGPAVSGDLPVMRVSVGGGTRQLALTASSGPVPMLRAALAGGDPLLGALGRATGTIAVRIGDAAPLNLPPSTAIAAYLGQCANGNAPAPAQAETAGNTSAAANQSAPQDD